jgi:hypothetical protein
VAPDGARDSIAAIVSIDRWLLTEPKCD